MRITWPLLAIILLPAIGKGQSESTYIHRGPDGKSWTIGNGLIEREIRYEPRVGLYTSSWRHKPTGRDFMQRAQASQNWGAEFSFESDGERFAGAWGGKFELLGAGEGSSAVPGKQLSLRLKAKSQPLLVNVYYEVYDGLPVVRKWIVILNQGSAAVTLSHLSFEAVNAVPGSPGDLQVSGFYGTQPREIFFTGRVEDPAVVELNSRTGEGLVVMNEAPGYTKRTEMVGWGDGFEAMYDTDLFPFERRIEPGETFTSAKCSVAFFAAGHPTADPHWVVPTYTSRVLLKKGADYQPPWIYNTWEPFERGINRDIVGDLIAIAGRMNLDIFTIDDGWQADYGENRVNLEAFPQGLEEVGLLAGRNNLRLGLWVPLAAVSPNTAVYKEHPEWLCKDASGRPKFTGTAAGGQAVMCLATPYKEVAAKRLSELIDRYHLKYVKVDLTTVFNAYGESPGCYAQGHEHKTWAESLERIYEGIAYVTERIYREHPDVLLDLTFELWGQKHLIDYGLLAAGDLDWLSNVDDESPEAAGPRQARTLLYHRALAIPTDAMLIGNLHANTPALEERLATAMGSGPLFLGDLRKLTPAEQDWYGEKIRWFKKLRREVAINEGFFPLGAWEQPGAASWDGFARLSLAGEGLIALFKNESGAEQAEVRLPVFPEGSFRIRSVMTGESLGEFSGEQIRQGIPVRFPAQSKVQILEIRK
jgi:alpha-galactosidase